MNQTMDKTADATTVEFAKQLRHVADWVEQTNAGKLIRGIYPSAGKDSEPLVFVNSIADLRLLFSGHTATKTKKGSATDWVLVINGIQFRAAEYEHERGGTNVSEEVL